MADLGAIQDMTSCRKALQLQMGSKLIVEDQSVVDVFISIVCPRGFKLLFSNHFSFLLKRITS